MLRTTFSKLSELKILTQALDSCACIVQHKGKDRKPKSECLLINVTGLTPSAIEELAQASLIAVESARCGK